MAERRRSNFRRYTGGDPLAPPVDLREALDKIGESVMEGYSPERAMREFLRRGSRDQRGLDDLARRVAERRRELLKKHNLDGTLKQIKELLDRAVLTERKQLARDVNLDEGDRALAEMQLENLPPSIAGAVDELSSYQWQSSEARADYEQIKNLMGRELLDQRFAGMKDALESVDDNDRAAVSEMMNDLNELLEKHRNGEDTDEDFQEFMEKHGRFFPENPQNVDELVDAMAKRSAAAQRMLNSMSPEQRDELMKLSAQAFGSPDLMQSIQQLDANLRALRPGENWTGSERFEGDDSLGMGEAMEVMQDLADLDQLSEQLAQSYDGARLDDIDLDALARQLGDEAAVDARTLREIEKELRDSGAIRRDSSGRLQLTPKAMRQLGKTLLRDIAERMSNRSGSREMRKAGALGDLTGGSRPWEFGSTEPWDLPRTVLNSIRRRSGDTRGLNSSNPGRLIDIDDIEVSETESQVHAAVALLVDTSYSMDLSGHWLPMKRTALALHTLIKSRFRGDKLQLITFARYAEEMDIERLTGLEATWDKGTNLHHALLLANRHFRKHPNAQPVLLIVTDGEPTSHLEPDGRVFFTYPPHPVTIARAVDELDNSMRLGAQITFFRLGRDGGLARFIQAMARRVKGRVVAPEDDDLGAAVVESYLGSRRGESGSGTPSTMGDDSGQYFGRGYWVG